MTLGKGKRPRDPNQLAKWIVEQSTDELIALLPKPTVEPSRIDRELYRRALGETA